MVVGEKISKAIKEGKWLRISYLNKNKSTTFYWVAIKDLDFATKKLNVMMFNGNKSLNTVDAVISFEGIQSAEVIEFSSYDVPEKLITKIEHNLDKCKWLNYDHFNHNILNYYIECNLLDNDPSQKEYSQIPGIDLRVLKENKKFVLNDEQIKRIITDIYHFDINKQETTACYTLAINNLSIDSGKKKFVICYHVVTFDPSQKALILDGTFRFNQSFITDGRKHSLFNYIKMDMDDFTKTYKDNCDTYQNEISRNLRAGELINTRPDFMLLQRNFQVDLYETYEVIEKKYNSGNLPVPLKSFFGNITKRNNVRRKEPNLIIYDKIDIQQARVLYNAIKYPVTYVQGPPGTGKTHTIINVILSAFYNNKTLLICSSNNKPVDGIVQKLKQFAYKGEAVNFPYLRLGNREDVKKATLRIRELFQFTTSKKPKDELLNKIKISTDDENSELVRLLKIQEKKVDIQNCLDSANKLIGLFEDKSSGFVDIVKNKVSQLRQDLKELPDITNDEVNSLFIPLKENYQLSQFIFFKSLQYINKLKSRKYAELNDICNIVDDDTRVDEFNKWTQKDENMKMLCEVFPIISSTNISTRRLGTPNFMFDLVIMDEAGQCNVATALIPIAKAESLLLVGDPNQLKPIVVLEEQINEKLMEKYNVPSCYDYKKNSILDVMLENDNISKYILLKYHYRCGKKIIGFSNQRYYNNSLDLSYLQDDGELQVLNVDNMNMRQKNEAYEEAAGIVNYIERNNITDAAIITPFVNQKELINSLLKQKNMENIDCGTIHSVQGAEKNTIIFSLAISPKTSKKTYEWLKNNYELINVAVTRAKKKLIISVDNQALNALSDKTDDIYNLIKYATCNGNMVLSPNESFKIEIGKSNGSFYEDEFYSTVSQFCSCHRTFEAERNVRLAKLFKGEKEFENCGKEFDFVLYEKRFYGKKPVVVFEVNGGEHFGTPTREQSDKAKIEICKKKNIKIIFIPNSLVKAYEFIADIILALKDKNTSLQQSMFD